MKSRLDLEKWQVKLEPIRWLNQGRKALEQFTAQEKLKREIKERLGKYRKPRLP